MIDQRTLDKFEKLYKESYDEVSRYVVCNCNYIEDVKDIIQNTYMAVFKKIDRIESKEYILGIAKNKTKDYYRFKYRSKIVDINDDVIKEVVPDDFDLEQSVFLKYDAEKVWEYLTKKPVTVAKVFYLYFYSQMTIRYISRELDMTESNVKNYIYRNLKELNKYLQREGKE